MEFETIGKLMRSAVPEIAYEFERANRPTKGHLGGEMLLLMAELEDAVEFIHGHCAPGLQGEDEERERKMTRRWFMSDDPNYCALSFVVVCDYLGLDYRAVRKAVLARKAA